MTFEDDNMISLSLSLSLSHTHTHTHTQILCFGWMQKNGLEDWMQHTCFMMHHTIFSTNEAFFATRMYADAHASHIILHMLHLTTIRVQVMRVMDYARNGSHLIMLSTHLSLTIIGRV